MVLDIIRELNSKFDEVEINLIYEEAEKYDIERSKVDRVIEELDRTGVLYHPDGRKGYIRLAERG
jgi:DNA replicative helicase MCM subunit Mcm2 (Cdc46/Mcm family)